MAGSVMHQNDVKAGIVGVRLASSQRNLLKRSSSVSLRPREGWSTCESRKWSASTLLSAATAAAAVAARANGAPP